MTKNDSKSPVYLKPFDNLVKADESREELKRERLIEISISLIHDFSDHPYKVRDLQKKFLTLLWVN